jgi:Family of unknown function (DUF6152)
MKIRRGIPLLVSFVYLMIASSLFAHHGVPNFDMSRTVTVKGVVIDYLLINPHMEMRVKVIDDTGNSVEWNVEAVSLLMMLRAGYKRDTFKPGDVVTVTGHPNKEGKSTMVLIKIVLPDGREMLTGYDGGR